MVLFFTVLCKAESAHNIQKRLDKHVAINAVDTYELARAIYNVSKQYKVSSDTILRIIIVESRGVEAAYNAVTKDYGLMQVNERTAAAYGFSMKCLRRWQCNLEAGAAILHDLSKRRVCAYNVGTGNVYQNATLMQNCLRYERKLATVN